MYVYAYVIMCGRRTKQTPQPNPPDTGVRAVSDLIRVQVVEVHRHATQLVPGFPAR